MLRAIETFHAGDLTIVAGETVDADHEIVAGREHLFAEVDTPTRPRGRRTGKHEAAQGVEAQV
jgi:hypothetical protein